MDLHAVYYVGSTKGYSSTFGFKTFPRKLWKTKIAIIGDLGAQNAISLPYLEEKIHENQLDLVIHAGDFAYDLRDDSGFQGDRFMTEIEPVAAFVPYMTCPGNHEHPNQYNEYRNTVKLRKLDVTSIFLGNFFVRLIFEGDLYSRATFNSSIRLGSQSKIKNFLGLRHFKPTYDEQNGENVL